MQGLIWTAVVWMLVLGVGFIIAKRRGLELGWFRRESIALVLALLATHAIAGKSEAEEVLANPLVLERAVRGTLAGAALLLAVPPLLQRINTSTRGHRGLTSLTAYVLIAFASVLYSAAPLVSAAKAFELSAVVVVVAAVALGNEPAKRIRQTISFVITLEVALVIMAIIGFFLLSGSFSAIQSRPGFFSDTTLVAPYAHSNSLSATGALLAAFALARAFESEKRRGWIVLFLIGTAGTVLASGRQGVAIWVVSVAVLTFIHQRVWFMTALGPGTALLTILYWTDVVQVLSRNRPQNFTNLTGRLPWWEAAVDAWAEHPWTGYGFGAGGRFVALKSIGRSSTSSVHSGYLETLVGVGLIGSIAFLYTVVRVLKWSAGLLMRRTEAALGILIVPLILRTFISLGFGGWLNMEFALFALLVAASDQDWIEARLPRQIPRNERANALT